MALTDFLKKKYEELTAPRLSQPRPNASQVVQNAIVNSIPIVGSLNSFMGRNNGGVNPNLNIPQVYRSGAKAVEQGVNFVQPIANKAAGYYFNGLHPANQNNFLYRNVVKPFVVDSLLNAPLNAVKANSQFIQNPSVKGLANMTGQNAQTALNFFAPTSVGLKAGQKVLPQIPRLLSNSAVKVGLPAGVSTGMITYGQGGSKEDIMRNSYEAFLAGTGFGVGFPVAGRLGSNTLSGIKNKFIPKPQISFLDSGMGGKGSPVTSTTRNALEKPLVVEPFKDQGNLSTTTLSKLEGKTTVKKQFIQDLTNAPDLKQNERELIRMVLDDFGDTVNIKDFAKKVKAELLPLKARTSEYGLADYEASGKQITNRYENITLPDELRGNVANYNERIYESPIQTSAGNVHFSGSTDNYFGHTRVEDLGVPQGVRQSPITGDSMYESLGTGDTRRVIEIQSDLYQKGNLEGELTKGSIPYKKSADLPIEQMRNNGWTEEQIQKAIKDADGGNAKIIAENQKRIAKLQQYNDPTAHFRMIREEVKKAAEDGKTKLQFPTGETAMNIEGLVNRSNKWVTLDNKLVDGTNIKKGDLITYYDYTINAPSEDRRFLITQNNGDGTFKAVDSITADNNYGFYDLLDKKGLLDDGRQPTLEELAITGNLDDIEIINYLENISENLSAQNHIDQNNPIYKFYEKEVGRYLKNKYNAELVTDAQGVTWWEVDLRGKGFESKPVSAFLETKKLKPDPLVQEAKKYKSAEEFVKGQGKPVYHGTVDVNQKSFEKFGFDITKNKKGVAESPYGLFVSKDIEEAGMYGKNPIELYPQGNIKVLNQSSKEWADTMGRSKSVADSTRIARELKKKGYDLIDSGDEQLILSPEKFKTKSQLTDIWNKANKPKTEQSFLEIKKPITINPLKSDAEKVGISESSLRRALPKLSRKPPATPQPPDKVVFREELNRALGKQASGELRAVQEAIPFTKVDNKEAEAIIDAIQDPKANIPTYAKYGDYIKNIRAKFDELFKEAEDTGMDIGYRENYLPQIWKETDAEIAEKMASVRGGFKFKKERKIPTYAEGKSLGLTPKYTHPAELIEAWVRNFERAKANFEFSQRLQQKGIIVPGDLVSPALPNYRAITAGGFPTSQNNIPFYAPKEIADAINTAFEIKESPRLLDIAAKVSSKVQDIGLSGGILRTPINAFSVAQVVKEVTSGRIVSPIASAFRATFGDFRKYVGKNADVIREIQEAGTPLRLNTSIRNFLDQSTSERLFGKSFSEAWNKNISEATFGKFMPMLQVEFYKDVKAQALKSGIGDDEAIKVANKALRNFYGLADMATDATRSKVTSDIWTILVLAPRYRESMIRFWVNNAKAMKNPTALENRQNVKFVIGAVISAVAYDLLNRQFNEGRGILDNPPGKEDKLLIPLDDGRTIGVPFLSSIATLPRTAFKIGKNVVTGDFKQAGLEAKALGSFAYKPLLDIIQNEDYFGNKIVDDDSKNAVRDRFAYLTKAYAHPYMRELLNAYAPDWLATKSQQDVPVSQRFMQAFELPIRFYKTSGIKGSYYYKAKDDNLKKLSTKERELYDKLNAPSEVDDAGLPVYNIRSEMANALDRLSNPKITQIETKIALDTARSTGEKPNPFYLLSPKQQETVLLLKTFYPGDKTKSEITNANKSWLEPYWKARDEFIGGLKAKGVIKENPSFNQRPQPTPQLQSKLDFYNTLPSGTGARSSFIRANADVEQFFNDSRNYTNSQRADLGLPLLAGYSSSGRGRKPKKLRAIKIKIPKIKTAKIKKPKKIKMYSMKKIKSKKIKLRTSLT